MQPLTIPRSEHMTGAQYAKLRRNGYHRMVDSTVTVRMIRALRRIGYSNKAIAAGTGVAHQNVIGNLANETNTGLRSKVYVETAEAVAAYYWRHHGRPRTDADGRRMTTWAAKRGWPSPMAYDDITDPSDQPKGVVPA